jgi:hypothetical protein
VRNGLPKFATNAYFFEEGHDNDYAKARFGEFRVAPDGDAIKLVFRHRKLVGAGSCPLQAVARRSPKMLIACRSFHQDQLKWQSVKKIAQNKP